MDKVSNKALREAQSHAALVQQYAERMRKLSTRLAKTGHIIEAHKAQIEQCSHLMQQAAQIILDVMEFAHQQPEHATEAYGLAVEYYIQANQQQFKATQLLIDARKAIEWQALKAL